MSRSVHLSKPSRGRSGSLAAWTTAAALLISLTTSCSLTHPQSQVALRGPADHKSQVVLVHGIFDTNYTMQPLIAVLLANGYDCLVPTLKPWDGRRGLEPMARQLRDIIDQEFRDDTSFSIVAFSMGGLISRHYLQELGGAVRCDGLYTVSTPHKGTYTAYLYPGRGMREMRPNSRFLKSLQMNEDVFETVPATSYRNPLDIVILPQNSPKWSRGDNVMVASPLHQGVLWERKFHEDLLRRLAENARP